MSSDFYIWLSDAALRITSVRFSLIAPQALAPAFLLLAVAAFLTLLMNRLWRVSDRIRELEEKKLAHLDGQDRALLAKWLARRGRLLYRGIRSIVAAGICVATVILIVFFNALVGMQREWGASLLFVISIVLFAHALICLFREINVAIKDFDRRYRHSAFFES
ncbi:DUF2721 domain-containing protein [Labrys portucalensis]|uniref:DUF2721 domain-containing protein n=1 Tax=Labrys neptuniae TaxID=376174 RepID=A0ABV3PTJ7_9HYPH